MSNPFQNFDEYGLRYYPTHLAELEDEESLLEVLTDFDFLQTKLNIFDITVLIADYNLYPKEETLRLVGDALRLSAHILNSDKLQLPSQLLGRLLPVQEERQAERTRWKVESPPTRGSSLRSASFLAWVSFRNP